MRPRDPGSGEPAASSGPGWTEGAGGSRLTAALTMLRRGPPPPAPSAHWPQLSCVSTNDAASANPNSMAVLPFSLPPPLQMTMTAVSGACEGGGRAATPPAMAPGVAHARPLSTRPLSVVLTLLQAEGRGTLKPAGDTVALDSASLRLREELGSQGRCPKEPSGPCLLWAHLAVCAVAPHMHACPVKQPPPLSSTGLANADRLPLSSPWATSWTSGGRTWAAAQGSHPRGETHTASPAERAP